MRPESRGLSVGWGEIYSSALKGHIVTMSNESAVTSSTLADLHRRLIEHMLADPTATIDEMASAMSVYPSSVAQIVNSDLFQARIHELRKEGTDVAIATIKERLAALANYGLEKLSQRICLETDPEKIARIVDMALRNMKGGATGALGTPQTLQANFFVASPDQLSTARNIMENVRSLLPPIPTTDDSSQLLEGEAYDIEHSSMY